MKVPTAQAIDCDLHLPVPDTRALLPYLDEFWRDQFINRHIDRANFALTSYPSNNPLSMRPDWRPASGAAASDLARLRSQALDPFGTTIAVCSTLHGAPALFNEDMAAALCSAVNDWVANEWLDHEPRLRGSILITPQNVERAVEEIERLAPDRRFVQILLPAMSERLLGNRQFWPIYRAAEKHGLVVGVHAGSTYRTAPTASGWPSFQVEDYIAQAGAFENLLLSFLAEGVFSQFPNLKLVCIESGFTWLPTLLWRQGKMWRAVRPEVPWIDRSPADIVRDHVRFTLQPCDLPKDESRIARILEHLRSDDLLLFSTDYPHWHFDGEDVLPEGLSAATIRKILIDTPLATYPRLRPPADVRASVSQEISS
jgi:hypothetical protein